MRYRQFPAARFGFFRRHREPSGRRPSWTSPLGPSRPGAGALLLHVLQRIGQRDLLDALHVEDGDDGIGYDEDQDHLTDTHGAEVYVEPAVQGPHIDAEDDT